MQGVDLKLTVFLANHSFGNTCKTDSVGCFAFIPPIYYGNGFGRFTATLNGKLQNFYVILNRGFSPLSLILFGNSNKRQMIRFSVQGVSIQGKLLQYENKMRN